MGLSFTLKLTWNQFWDAQQNNPNNELLFMYKGKCYILQHGDYIWEIAEYNNDTDDIGKTLVSAAEKNYGHRNYHDQANWDDLIAKCYDVVTAPIFDGKSFRDVIEEMLFY